MVEDALRDLTVEPYGDGWVIMVDGDIMATTTDSAQAETIARLAAERANRVRAGDLPPYGAATTQDIWRGPLAPPIVNAAQVKRPRGLSTIGL